MSSNKKNKGKGYPKEESKHEYQQKKYRRKDDVDAKQVKQIPTVEGAYFDDLGFYNLPDGDFYDPDGWYFDKDGYDQFGGKYDDDNNYIPGQGNKHMFEDYDDEEEDDMFENDELAKQFEGDDNQENDYIDPETKDS